MISICTVWEKRDVVAIETLREILSEETTRERRALLAVSSVTIFSSWTGLFPRALFGLDFTRNDLRAAFTGLTLVMLYFLASFVVDALNDYFVWCRRVGMETTKAQTHDGKTYHVDPKVMNPLRKDERRLRIFRFLLKMGLPVLLGLVGLVAGSLTAVRGHL